MSIAACSPDAVRLLPLLPSMKDDNQLAQIKAYGIVDPFADPDGFPYCCISKNAIAYACGIIARREDRVTHAHSPGEIEKCVLLAAEVSHIMEGVTADWGSEGTPERGVDHFLPFFRAATEGEIMPTRITEDLIRHAFGGTLNPRCVITVEALATTASWWSRLLSSYGKSSDARRDAVIRKWTDMTAWFHSQAEFLDTSFIQIREPSGYGGSVFPQLVIGLTTSGSVIGMIGNGVHT